MGESRYYKLPVMAVPDEQMSDAINALRTEYTDGGWLSTLVWNIRNAYSAIPNGKFSAEQMRMVVEGFLAELAQHTEGDAHG